uniref:G_PROTEIN_RECEP_F1_2 domain-containing protein n=1 Tax=Gongylonema pulchrum TaxID=637853 RepID=A0A183EZB6_9BILA
LISLLTMRYRMLGLTMKICTNRLDVRVCFSKHSEQKASQRAMSFVALFVITTNMYVAIFSVATQLRN